MTTKQPYPEEFNIEAVKQITERGHRVADVSARIGVSQHSPVHVDKGPCRACVCEPIASGADGGTAPLKAELKRVTEERDILKKAAAYFARQFG